MATKIQFLAAYRALVVAEFKWAADQEKLDRFMDAVAETISTPSTRWAWNGPVTGAAWHHIGRTGRPTLKALRELDD